MLHGSLYKSIVHRDELGEAQDHLNSTENTQTETGLFLLLSSYLSFSFLSSSSFNFVLPFMLFLFIPVHCLPLLIIITTHAQSEKRGKELLHSN